ncbi:unnamed protein product [Acanthoscelides obtectus]|nr:unnamed protein product [Acanthoscelides obtectus]CAK1649050.1 Zinc finger protein 346 [Acanthoscelides obtectus]
MAKMHYKSKNHEKKIRKFLIEYSQKTGEPLHKRARVTAAGAKTEEEPDPKWFHCEVCDLVLTGKLHAESHYMGKNHQKAMLGYKRPAGKGYYNAEGKWVRQTSSKKVLAPGEDTFGLDFRKPIEASPTPAVPTVSQPPAPQQHRWTCDMCGVVATCQEQLDMHLKGQKHQKKLRQLGFSVPAAKEPNTAAVASAATDKTSDVDLSVYRTPSGDFYCPHCNTTMNAEVPFRMHLKSKAHMKNYTTQKQ